MPPPVDSRASAHVTTAESTIPNADIAQGLSDSTEASSIAFPDIDWTQFHAVANPISAFEGSYEGKAFFTAVARLTQEAESVTSKQGLLKIPRSILQRTGVSVHSLPPAEGETGHQIPINNPKQELEVLKLTAAAFEEIGAKLHELKHETNPAKKNLNHDRLTHLLCDLSEEWSACAEGVKGRLSDFLMAIRAESTIRNSVQSAKQRLVNAAATQFWNSCWDTRHPEEHEWMLDNQQHFINGVYKELGHRYGLDKEIVDNYVLSNFVHEHYDTLNAVLDKTLTESAIARVLATDYMDRLAQCIGVEPSTQHFSIAESWATFTRKLNDAKRNVLDSAFGEVLQSQLIALDGESFHLQRDLSALSEQLVRNARQAFCLTGVAAAGDNIKFDYNDGYLFCDQNGRLWQEGRAPDSPPEPLDPTELGHYLLSQPDSYFRYLLRTLGGSAETKAIVLDALSLAIRSQTRPESELLRLMMSSYLVRADLETIVSSVTDLMTFGNHIISELDMETRENLLVKEHTGIEIILDAVAKVIEASADPAQTLWKFMTVTFVDNHDFDRLLSRLPGRAGGRLTLPALQACMSEHLQHLPASCKEVDPIFLESLDSGYFNVLLPMELRAEHINGYVQWLHDFSSSHDCELFRRVMLSLTEAVSTRVNILKGADHISSHSQLSVEASKIVTNWNALLRELADTWDKLPAKHTPPLIKRLMIYMCGLHPHTGEALNFQEAVNTSFFRKTTAFACDGSLTSNNEQRKTAHQPAVLPRSNSLDSRPSHTDNQAFQQTRKIVIDLMKDENIDYLMNMMGKLRIDPWSSGAAIGAYGNQTLLQFAEIHGGPKARAFLQSIIQPRSALSH